MENIDEIIIERQERQKQIEAFFGTLSKIAKQLCAYDWMFINELNHVDLIDIQKLLDKKDSQLIDFFFEKHFETNIELLKNRLIDSNTKRINILNEIFKGIELKLFSLVIPSIISQIEGITEEKTGRRFFSTQNNQTKLKQFADSKNIMYFDKLLTHPIDTIWEYSRKQNPNNPSRINRHDIIHGTSIDYGTKMNCYKYLSVLLFVSENLDRLNRK